MSARFGDLPLGNSVTLDKCVLNGDTTYLSQMIVCGVRPITVPLYVSIRLSAPTEACRQYVMYCIQTIRRTER